VALLTGSKNALKGVGFFLGGALLTMIGFRPAVSVMAVALAIVWLASIVFLRMELGRAKVKPKFHKLMSKSRAINVLSAARLFLFGARDIWFVVALPVFLSESLGWDFWRVGGFLALWVIGYGGVQSIAPRLVGKRGDGVPNADRAPVWAAALAVVPLAMAVLLANGLASPAVVLVVGLGLFGVLFAINSSLHSYMIVAHATEDGVSLDVGFYYMANAMGRLIGTVLSGWIFQAWGLATCLAWSAAFVLVAAALSLALPRLPEAAAHISIKENSGD
jgi:predicted MFS family arabinose efflux permease